jgi:hypothetical protein
VSGSYLPAAILVWKQRIAIYAMPPPRSMTFLRQRLALPSVRSRRDCRVLGACETPGHEQHLINHGVHVPLDAGIATIGPLSVGQLNLFAHKVVLALHFAHFRRGLSADGNLCVLAVQRGFCSKRHSEFLSRPTAQLRHNIARSVGRTRPRRPRQRDRRQ